MTPQEIIEADSQRTGNRVGAVLGGVMAALDKNKAELFHHNKVAIILEPIKKSKTDWSVHMFSANPPLNLKQSAPILLQQVQANPNIRKVYGDPTDLEILNVLKSVGFNVQRSDRKDFQWMVEI
jgi:hypothetical protein